MVELFGPSGAILNPKQPSGGLYIVGQCPTCKSPIYYHGGGTQTVKQSTVDEQIAEVTPITFSTCACFQDKEMQLTIKVPQTHNPLMERQAVIALYERVQALQYAYSQLLNQGTKKGKTDA